MYVHIERYIHICTYEYAAIEALVRVSRKLCSCSYIPERRSEEMENE